MTQTVPWIEAIDRRENWQALSICGPEHDAILFAGGRRKSRERERLIRQAQALCEMCPVQRDCLGFAERRKEKNGVWGGKDFSTQSDRTVQRHRRSPPTKGTERP